MSSAASHEFRPKEAIISGVLLAVARGRRVRDRPQAADRHLARRALGHARGTSWICSAISRLGFGVALTPVNLLYALIGVVLGTLIGVLPGIGPVATIAMLLPTTYALQPVSALIMLAGIYYGAQYGGSTTAILINMPGESSSVVTCLDGHQMARKGQAGAALTIAALGSFFAGTVATILVASVAIPLSELALKFGPAEYFSLMVLGLIGAVVLAHGSLLEGDRDDHPRPAARHRRHRRQLGRRALRLRHSGAHRRHRRRDGRDGAVRLRRDHQQPRSRPQKREMVAARSRASC